jgi:hypothetical protein
MTVGSAEELKPNEDITSKQEVGSTCNIASSLPQPLNQLYAPNLFPKGKSVPAISFSLLQAVESNLLSSGP